MNDLHLNLKAEYFDAIKDGSKLFEYRRCTPYWVKRLVGKEFGRVFIKRGYPAHGDMDRTLVRAWAGYEIQKITHPHFGPAPVEVFAIRVGVAL